MLESHELQYDELLVHLWVGANREEFERWHGLIIIMEVHNEGGGGASDDIAFQKCLGLRPA